MEKFMKEHEEKRGYHSEGNKKLVSKQGPHMPPSTLIDIVLGIVKKAYWEAKSLSGQY